jgi:hypothetical protein
MKKNSIFSFVAFLILSLPALAQTPSDTARGDTVSWTVTAPSGDAVKHGEHLAVALHGTVLDGWHVYSLRQAPEGPTPLFVSLDTNPVAAVDGVVTESKPTKIHDPAFGLDTQFYEKAFTVTVPIRIKAHQAAGQQVVALNVRFQTCNGRVCQPPKTVRLTAPIDLPTGVAKR